MQGYINKALKQYNRLNTPLDEDITPDPVRLFLEQHAYPISLDAMYSDCILNFERRELMRNWMV